MKGGDCYLVYLMRGSRKFCQRRSNIDSVFFLLMRGKEDPNTTINGSSSARQRFAGGPKIAQH